MVVEWPPCGGYVRSTIIPFVELCLRIDDSYSDLSSMRLEIYCSIDMKSIIVFKKYLPGRLVKLPP